MSKDDMRALLAKIAEDAKKAQKLTDERQLRRAINSIWVEAGRIIGS